MFRQILVVVLLAALILSGCLPVSMVPQEIPGQAKAEPTNGAGPVELRVAVSVLPEILADYQRGIDAIEQKYSSVKITVEVVPPLGEAERFATQLSAGTLPDVILISGLSAQQWIRQGAFADLTPYVQRDAIDLNSFYPDTVAQFAYDGKQWGIPNEAAPEVLFYNKAMFDAAHQPYPTDEWTFEDMRAAARKLTLDNKGRNADDPAFDSRQVAQWGWNSTPQHIWTRHLVEMLGADYCQNSDCTLIKMSSPDVVAAFRWWADLAQKDHSAPYDVYSGAQTGVPGDPFVAGKAAMGFNNSAAIGQLNTQTQISYDVVQPFKGADGKRHGALSTQGYVIAATSKHKDEAWQIVRALTSDEFLTEYFARPGHGIPALRSAAQHAIDTSHPPANQQALLEALEYGEVFRPYTASAFEAYAKTVGFYVPMMKGDVSVEDSLRQIEEQANAILAKDR